MTGRLTPESLRAYVNRPWRKLREAKEKHWADQSDPTTALATGAALWEHVRAVDPTWPNEEQRVADYNHHVELTKKLRRLSNAFPSSGGPG